ncbi:coiled-coil domain-containing protein 142 isoform X2 [Paroedura picta]|uniref:coiled-coil domain-containing protein 142 isoform X2 n=1 Tax=Paroedura picta TaxID=143630 RepID=UPI004056D6E1
MSFRRRGCGGARGGPGQVAPAAAAAAAAGEGRPRPPGRGRGRGPVPAAAARPCPARSGAPLAQSLRAAEALLRRCLRPGRLPPPRPSGSPEASDDDDDEEEPEEAWPGGVARLAQVERGLLGLSRGLAGQEEARAESLQGHGRPEPAQAAFAFHAARGSVARHSAALHALLQQRHHLRLARSFSRRLGAASAFVRRLRDAQRPLLLAGGRPEAGWGRLLRALCEELRTHAAHWDALQRQLRSDPWLQPLLLQRHEAVLHMQEAFSALALQALCLLEHCLEALLRRLAHTPPQTPATLSEFFQGLDIYNQVAREKPWQRFSVALWAEPGSRLKGNLGWPSSFPGERVLSFLAAERGQRAASRLLRRLLLGLGAEAGGVGAGVPWEGGVRAWLPDAAPPAGEGAPSLSAELQALGQAEEEHLLRILGELVASTGNLWHNLLHRPKQEQPPMGLEASDGDPGQSDSASLPAWKAVRWLDASYSEAAGALYTQYCPLIWSATATSLTHQLELHSPPAQIPSTIIAILSHQLGRASFHVSVPQESAEELQGLLLHLLVRRTLQHWDQDFCHALGSSLTDKCMATLSETTAVASSRTARLLQGLFPPLAFSLRCVDAWSLGGPGCRLDLLSLSVAASQAACYWALSRASRYLASGSLSQFLLVAQGDVQLLQAEVSRMVALAGTAPSSGGKKHSTLVSWQEQELSHQIRALATSLQHFTVDTPRLFASACKHLSAEIFGQTMPLGKHWRLALQTDIPPSPSEYASSAAQAVLGQVLQGIQLLPCEAREPALSQVTAAFLEAWMDHILAQQIKFRPTTPLPASCSSPARPLCRAKPGKLSTCAAPTTASAHQPVAQAASTAWRAWKACLAKLGLPGRARQGTCSAAGKEAAAARRPTSAHHSRSGWHCGCTGAAAGKCLVCPACTELWSPEAAPPPRPVLRLSEHCSQVDWRCCCCWEHK